MNSEHIRDNIVLPAWKIINGDGKIKQYYFLPWLLSVVFLTAILSYQIIYTYVTIWNHQEEVLQEILHFLERKYVIEILIIAGIFLILYFLLIPIFEWWLIKYIDAKSKWISIWCTDAFWYWLNKFLPFSEYNNFFSEFKLITIFNFFLFTLRFVWIEYLKEIIIIYLIAAFAWMILNVLFAYSKYAIILNNKFLFSAIWESVKIAILNLKVSVKLYFLVFILNLRVIINMLVFLFFPILIVATISLISTKFLMIITLIILLSVFIVLILFISYLAAVLDIFKTALWYYAYEDGRKKIDDEDDDD